MLRPRRWRSYFIILFFLAVSVAGTLYVLHSDLLPTMILRQAIAFCEERWPVQLAIGEYKFFGLGALAFRDVNITWLASQPPVEPIFIEEVQIHFSLTGLTDLFLIRPTAYFLSYTTPPPLENNAGQHKGAAREKSDLEFLHREGSVQIKIQQAHLIWEGEVEGHFDFQGHWTGGLLKPRLKGEFVLQDGRLRDEPIDKATGRLALDATSLHFEDVCISTLDYSYNLAGHLAGESLLSYNSLSAQLDVQKGRLEQLIGVLAFPAPVQVQGAIEGSLYFVGDFGAVVSSGEANLHDVNFFDTVLDEISGSFTWQSGNLILKNVAARLDQYDTVVKGLAWVGTNGDSLAEPWFRGHIEIDQIYANSQQIKNLEGAIAYDGRDLVSPDLLFFTGDGGRVVLDGEIRNLDLHGQETLALKARLRNQPLATLLNWSDYQIPVNLLDGRVHGTAAVSGSLADPQIQLHLELSDASFLSSKPWQIDLRVGQRRVEVLRWGGI